MSKISPGLLAPPHEMLTPDEWRARGRARRERVALADQAGWQPLNQPDPVTILKEQAKTRVHVLVPIRYGRMLTSPFAYFRGPAAPMAWDLAHRPTIERNPDMLNGMRSAIALYKETLAADRREARVARGQRTTRAATDEFLGWTKGIAADRNKGRDCYVPQLRDMKGGTDVPAMDPGQLNYYGRPCGWAPARGHARTGRATVISGYLGESKESDYAIADFALAHADQNAKDYQGLMDAVANGQVQAVMGLSGANPQPRLTGPLLPRALAAGPGPAGPCGVACLRVGYPM